MRVVWQGRDLGIWNGMPTLAEARMIKQEIGIIGPEQLQEAIQKLDPDALSIFIAILLTRNGTPTKWTDVDGDLIKLEFQLTDEEKAALSEEDKKALDDWGKDASLVNGSADANGSSATSATQNEPSMSVPSDSGSTSA